MHCWRNLCCSCGISAFQRASCLRERVRIRLPGQRTSRRVMLTSLVAPPLSASRRACSMPSGVGTIFCDCVNQGYREHRRSVQRMEVNSGHRTCANGHRQVGCDVRLHCWCRSPASMVSSTGTQLLFSAIILEHLHRVSVLQIPDQLGFSRGWGISQSCLG